MRSFAFSLSFSFSLAPSLFLSLLLPTKEEPCIRCSESAAGSAGACFVCLVRPIRMHRVRSQGCKTPSCPLQPIAEPTQLHPTESRCNFQARIFFSHSVDHPSPFTGSSAALEQGSILWPHGWAPPLFDGGSDFIDKPLHHWLHVDTKTQVHRQGTCMLLAQMSSPCRRVSDSAG